MDDCYTTGLTDLLFGLAAEPQVELRLDTEPSPPWWQHLRLWLLSRLVPQDLL